LEKLPKGRRTLTGKWVFKRKLDSEGKVVRYKARWVVWGFLQQYGVDYYKTYTSVVNAETYRLVFAMVAFYDLECDAVDVVGAFLYGLIDREIWVKPPEGIGIAKGIYYRLLKSLYGLKQAPRIWQKMLSEVFTSLSFKQLRTDPAVYILRYPEDKGTPTIIMTYVDDIVLCGLR
jgi:Reverse transcriptase (RNA-dependent DNA polymerase)